MFLTRYSRVMQTFVQYYSFCYRKKLTRNSSKYEEKMCYNYHNVKYVFIITEDSITISLG